MPRHTQREAQQHLDVARRDVGKAADEVVEQILAEDHVVAGCEDLPNLPRVLRAGWRVGDDRSAPREDGLVDAVDAVGGEEQQPVEIL